MMFPPFDKLVEEEFDQNCRLLADAGFPDAESCIRNLTDLRSASLRFEAGRDADRPHTVPPWFKTLKRILLEAPFPSAVLHATDSFVRQCRSTDDAFILFEETPRSLEVLARLSCGSPFLTQVLMNQPSALRELTIERRTAAMKSREDFFREAQQAVAYSDNTQEKLSQLRQYQRREILRIGMCDAFGLLDLKFVTLQISLLADAMVQICLELACADVGADEPPFSVVALGKHGGEELNYSSDIDLILIAPSETPVAQKTAHRLIEGLSRKMATGFLYRVDMRLRPWGSAGPLVSTPDTYEEYLRNHAALWEKQALLKARVVAGAPDAGNELMSRLPPLLFSVSEQDVLSVVRATKGQIEQQLKKKGRLASEVKLGAGSIRDIEFLAQALQLIHGQKEPRIASANTLDALVRLAEFGLMDVTTYRQLREGYIFLRTIEHALQLLHNQQTHELPADTRQLEWLSRRMDYPGETELLSRFREHKQAVRRIFDAQFTDATADVRLPQKKSPAAASNSNPSTLTKYFSSNAVFHEQLRERLFRDLDDKTCCRVHSEDLFGDVPQRLMTIAATEVSGLTSILCGLFFASRLDIREGETINGGGRSRFEYVVPPATFLGVFVCEDTSVNSHTRQPIPDASLQKELENLIRMQQTQPDSDVRETLVEMFCRRVADLAPATQPLADLSIEVAENEIEGLTVLKITADDSFGFFFELSNALSICGFRILRAELGVTEGRIHDVIYVSEASGGPVKSQERIEELRTAVTLIKQFTAWLPSNNDPHQALIRFRDLLHVLLQKSEWKSNVADLRQPEVLRDVAQVLGISRYLWEDFLQVRTDNLLPLLTDTGQLQRRIPRPDLVEQLQRSLSSATDDKELAKALNTFKDHHLFRIDLRHVLGHCGPFGAFSEEITELAEIVVDAACHLAGDSLQTKHGVPRLADGSPCPFVIVALGKFGGVEMGFASDIEMFGVFSEDCRTDGPSPLSAASFFERVVGRTSELIRTRHKGIFEVDLRMRPYGQAGSPAVSLETFRRYFSPQGDAWPYERQSLVRLRYVSGDPDFGNTVLEECHKLIYTDEGFDFDAMRAMREKQVRQLVRGGSVNAKLSDGGLVDCEYSVQALQLTFGKSQPSLRNPNTLRTMNAALKTGLLSATEHESAQTAYMFLRELIDCLRMVRGNALDLTVPVVGSADHRQLAKRMEAVHDSPLPLDELESQLAVVRAFSRRVEEICTSRR